MNILWIQDIDPRNRSGGAQITDHFMIEALEKEGHHVNWSKSPLQEFNDIESTSSINNTDIAVISNARKWQEKKGNQLKLELKSKEIPWIKYEHDHACKWRSFFPKQNMCRKETCPSKRSIGWQYRGASGIVYLSPFQKAAHEYWDGWNLKDIPAHIAPSYIPYSDFMEFMGNSRPDNTVLLVQSLYRFKGWFENMNFIRQNENLSYTHLADRSAFNENEMSLLDKYNVIPEKEKVPYEKMPEVYGNHSLFLHLADGYLPYERVVLEAFFAGCEIKINSNVGISSFEWFGDLEASIEAMDNTRQEFTEFVERIAND